MKDPNLQIDPYLFEKHFEEFICFAEEKASVKFMSFSSHPYTEYHEGYKYDIYKNARAHLAFQDWSQSDVGNGKIIQSTIDAIEIPKNNLIQWQARFGESSRPHQPLYEVLDNQKNIGQIESIIFQLYHSQNDEDSLNKFISVFGKRYPLIAYLFFIKDKSRYLPIAPSYFDKTFNLLGVDFKTSRSCSWENYITYVSLIGDLKYLLDHELSSEVTLLDAHSFAWILSSQMADENSLPNVKAYLNLDKTERDAIVKARIGQGQFRDGLINYWGSCAVTGCINPKLLIASHIKPWSKSTLNERLNIYNGLLLSPSLDSCFDSGLISFDYHGKILISSQLQEADQKALGINKNMGLRKLESEHKKFLKYHRGYILN